MNTSYDIINPRFFILKSIIISIIMLKLVDFYIMMNSITINGYTSTHVELQKKQRYIHDLRKQNKTKGAYLSRSKDN